MSPSVVQESVILTDVIRPAKAALYASCHYVSLAKDNEDGGGVLKTASSAIHILASSAIDPTTFLANEEEWVELQTGCIDFFAICLESYSLRRFNKDDEHYKEKDTETSTTATTLLSALDDIYNSLVGIIQNGQSTAADWIEPNSALLGTPWEQNHEFPTRIESFSPSARTCLWNVFLVVSQRCSLKDGHLKNWSKHNVPWIVRWGHSSSVTSNGNTNLHHPLCMAAALQLVFVVLTRSKAFDFLTAADTKQEI